MVESLVKAARFLSELIMLSLRADPRYLKRSVWDKEDKAKATDDNDNVVYPTAKRNIILIRHGQYNQGG